MYIFGKLLIALFVMNLNFMYASIKVVAAENFYGKLAETIGGEYVEVYNIMNSSVDPHSFVSSPRDMKSINYADIIIYNGSNYDPWIKHLLKLKDKEKNFVAIDVSLLTDLHYDPNPHIWFDPRTFPRLAQELCNLFEKTVSTQENSYFSRNLQKFLIEYEEVLELIEGIREKHSNVTATSTESVFGHMIKALGFKSINTRLQKSIIFGSDITPQMIIEYKHLCMKKKVNIIYYNQEQVQNKLIYDLLRFAKSMGIPTIGISETIPYNKDIVSWLKEYLKDTEKSLEMGITNEVL